MFHKLILVVAIVLTIILVDAYASNTDHRKKGSSSLYKISPSVCFLMFLGLQNTASRKTAMVGRGRKPNTSFLQSFFNADDFLLMQNTLQQSNETSQNLRV